MIEAIQDYPDDAPIVVAGDNMVRQLIANGYYEDERGGAKVHSIAFDPSVVRLEL